MSTSTYSSAFRLYGLDDLGADGYPPAWHERVKHEARVLAGDRCVRCLHPYQRGTGEWSPCDEQCMHDGPTRIWVDYCDGWAEGSHAGPRTYPGQRVQAQWRILTVHHLDGNKANCRWFNLCALCQRCHLQVQGKVQMARVWPWEHSPWFRVYVAGYYALTYLGEELDRAETEARLDELLALERAA